ncbi:basic leucine zipper 34 [Sesbania bispinosa]|nr:basic leucine zipper 34 [Sesbania bispinosa]
MAGRGRSRTELHAPFPRVALAPKPLLGPNSPFQGWQNINTSFGDSNANNANENNPPTNGSHVSGPARARPNLGHDSEPIMDSRKRRMVSNHLSTQKPRQKKIQYLANLEFQAKTYEAKKAELQPELASYQNKKHSLM